LKTPEGREDRCAFGGRPFGAKGPSKPIGEAYDLNDGRTGEQQWGLEGGISTKEKGASIPRKWSNERVGSSIPWRPGKTGPLPLGGREEKLRAGKKLHRRNLLSQEESLKIVSNSLRGSEGGPKKAALGVDAKEMAQRLPKGRVGERLFWLLNSFVPGRKGAGEGTPIAASRRKERRLHVTRKPKKKKTS